MNTAIAIIHPEQSETLETALKSRVSEVFYSIEQALTYIHQAKTKEASIDIIYASEHLSDGNGVDFLIRAKALLAYQSTVPTAIIIGARTGKVVREIALKRGIDQWFNDADALIGQKSSSSETGAGAPYSNDADVDESKIREIANDEVQDAILDHGTIMLMASKDSCKQMIAQSEETTINRLLKLESALNRMQTQFEQNDLPSGGESDEVKSVRHNQTKLDDEFHVLRQSLDQLELQVDQIINRQKEQTNRDEKAKGLATMAIVFALGCLGLVAFLHFVGG